MTLGRSAELLKALIAFPTISRTPNLALIEHVARMLGAAGIACTIVKDEAGTRANLFASTGPADVPGVMLSGHTDVVPVEGQPWTSPGTAGSHTPLPEIENVNAYPALDTHVASDAVRFLEALLPPDARKRKVAFGTEGGLFSTRLAAPTLVCGPGDIDVAHKPDEYVALAQLDACDAFLARLIGALQ